jgi:hypothetical protein
VPFQIGNEQKRVKGKSVSEVDAEPQARRPSVILTIGIVLLPAIFSWFVLRSGYSTLVRVLALGWAGLIVVAMVASALSQVSPASNAAQTPQTSAIEVDPDRAAKDQMADLAKAIVPKALKDPSSADFGEVYGVSPSVACGFVNAKNSFGAMTGQTRFIFDGEHVIFESGESGFARRWNAACVSKPRSPAPSGVGSMRWGSHPAPALRQYAPATDDGLSTYVPKGKPDPIEGVPVAEADYNFDRGKLYAADFYVDGEPARNIVLRAFIKRYGTPQKYNDGLHTYTWRWPKAGVSITVSYQESFHRTTINYNLK